MLDKQNKGQATEIDLRNLRETMKIAEESRAAGNHPFGALLAGPDGAGQGHQAQPSAGHLRPDAAGSPTGADRVAGPGPGSGRL